MFGTHDLPLFVATALVLNATPGVDMLFTLSRTLQHGWRTGMAAALGITAGCVVHTVAAALGLAALLATSALAFSCDKVARRGVLALARLGHAASVGARRGAHSCSVAANTINACFRARILDQRAESEGRFVFPRPFAAIHFGRCARIRPVAFLFLGAVFIVGGALFLFALVALAHRMRAFGASRVTRRLLNAIGGALFAALAVRLVQAER